MYGSILEEKERESKKAMRRLVEEEGLRGKVFVVFGGTMDI